MKITTIDRVRSKTSLHDEYKPEICDNGKNCPINSTCWWRTVRCGGNTDTVECGYQKETYCNFYEEYD